MPSKRVHQCNAPDNIKNNEKSESFSSPKKLKAQNGPATPEKPDARILLNLFSAELWKTILKNAKDDPHDFANLTNASSFFRRELHPFRVLSLFPLVYPLLQKYLTPSEILKCREICSTWNTFIQTSFLNHPSHQHLPFTPIPSFPATSFLPDPESFESHHQVTDFLRHFKSTHCPPSLRESLLSWFSHNDPRFESGVGLTSNPFPDGVVILSMPDRNPYPSENVLLSNFPLNINSYLDKPSEIDPDILYDAVDNGLEDAVIARPGHVSRAQWLKTANFLFDYTSQRIQLLLRLFGHHISFCTLESSFELDACSATFYAHLSQWMNLIPNVNVLKVIFHGDELVEEFEGFLNVQRHIEDCKFTKLNYLQFLQVDNLPAFIFDELLRVNSHIKKLKVTRVLDDVNVFDKKLPNLVSLAISVGKAENFGKVKGPRNGAWKLEELYLKIENSEGENLDQWATVFAVIQEKWEATLKLVEVQLPESANKKELRNRLGESYKLMSITTIL